MADIDQSTKSFTTPEPNVNSQVAKLVLKTSDSLRREISGESDTSAKNSQIITSVPSKEIKVTTSQPKDPYVPSYSLSGYFQGLGFLFLMLAILWLGARFLRRYGRFNFLPRPQDLPKDALRMESQLPLGPRKGLMVVRFFNKRLLLGVTEQQISVLTWEPVHDEDQASFAKLMDQAQNSKPKESS